MSGFIEIPGDFLRQISTDSDRVPTLYYSRYRLIRRYFWLRLRSIHKLIRKTVEKREKCLDFGGGGGVFLPTLAEYFQKVYCVDLETDEATKVIKRYNLSNVELIRQDIKNTEIADAPFDVIVAADVLEHFKDLKIATDAIMKWLKPDGYLFTSLPTENFLYRFLRKVFHVEKPWDHYYNAADVARFMEKNGFVSVNRTFIPLAIVPLYVIGVWQKKNG